MEQDNCVDENEIKEEQEEGYYPAPADMKHWGTLSYWTLDECVALLLELDPEIPWGKVEIYQELPCEFDYSLNYAKLKMLVLRAYEKKEITNPVTPSVFLAWAESRGLEISPELKQQVEKIKRNQLLLDEETQAILKAKDEEIMTLKQQVQELKSLVWDGFDENQSTHSKELAIAVKAHGAISKSWKKGMSIKQQIALWLEANYPKLMNEEKERIAKICNWQKSGGAPCTPG